MLDGGSVEVMEIKAKDEGDGPKRRRRLLSPVVDVFLSWSLLGNTKMISLYIVLKSVFYEYGTLLKDVVERFWRRPS